MKDIGTIFKEKREEIGIKEDEAAKDLNITIPQLENLEDGNINAFKDIFFLKDCIWYFYQHLQFRFLKYWLRLLNLHSREEEKTPSQSYKLL